MYLELDDYPCFTNFYNSITISRISPNFADNCYYYPHKNLFIHTPYVDENFIAKLTELVISLILHAHDKTVEYGIMYVRHAHGFSLKFITQSFIKIPENFEQTFLFFSSKLHIFVNKLV